MNDVSPAIRDTQSGLDARQLVADWLAAFEMALASGNRVALAALFEADSHWRDLLAFTWDITPTLGAEAIAGGLVERQPDVGARSFRIAAGRTPPRFRKRLGRDVIEALFELETNVGRGSGIVRLVPQESSGGVGARAWVFLTTLEALKGHEDKVGGRRPSGAAYSRNFGGDNWDDVRRKSRSYEDRDPAVIVIGGAQAGLCIAARLRQLEVDTLVVEKWPRIGDSWRKRYHSLALHNAIDVNHLPYMPFPPTWPKYIPKDMLGNWFEFYADAMEINCWTDTEFVGGTWDEAARCWVVRLKRGDGTERVMRPRHLVFANGVSSFPKIPELPGLATFKGTVVHSEGFANGAPWRGKHALILGTGSSAHDIAQDLHSHGAKPTIIQRGSTTVVSIDPSAKLNYALYDEGASLEDSDLIATSGTPPLIIKGYQLAVQRMVELDKEMIEGLKRVGFKYDIGEDNTGHQMKYRRRGGGYNLDAGAAALMIKGELGLLQFDRIERFCPEGALLKDGSIVPADLLVLATGYHPQQELVRRTLGDAIAGRVGQVWGIGPDGEMANMFKRTPQDGVWFIAGGLGVCRIYSKYLALQIKACELGLIEPRLVR
ncbi:MAG: NAD(P)/FAD-dependent oxidoreductase [Hyphomicrobiaceae bacterium]|nr:NAD(P)/FAD-dependent oxidoreductase [Hyphomicrobiaceae bacterium]